MLGGTQSLHTNSRDEALGLPTEESARLALRTQQIIAHETGVTNTADPLAGSRVVEEFTDAIESEVIAYLDRIDGMGGTLRAIENGYIQGEIQNAAYRFQQEVEAGQRVIVGVNGFRMEGATSVPLFRIDPEIERSQVEAIRSVRAGRDPEAWSRSLDEVEATARGTGNLMPRIVAAVEAWATVGEISDRLREVFGEYREVG